MTNHFELGFSLLLAVSLAAACDGGGDDSSSTGTTGGSTTEASTGDTGIATTPPTTGSEGTDDTGIATTPPTTGSSEDTGIATTPPTTGSEGTGSSGSTETGTGGETETEGEGGALVELSYVFDTQLAGVPLDCAGAETAVVDVYVVAHDDPDRTMWDLLDVPCEDVSIEVGPLPPGTYELAVVAWSPALWQGSIGPVEVGPEDTPVSVDLVEVPKP
ncbi:MAG: hypothetical protein ACE37F_27775 [Nannocystaceae bacterium]|nr:hypothetical protein [bacterium]